MPITPFLGESRCNTCKILVETIKGLVFYFISVYGRRYYVTKILLDLSRVIIETISELLL